MLQAIGFDVRGPALSVMNQELTISQKQIENRIFTVRGVQVMIDRDLADMYQVETKVLNQSVKRNIDRFPESFRFQLTEEETKGLITGSDNTDRSRSQFVTLNGRRGQNIKYLPYAFTEQGVAMLSAVLRSETAVKVSIEIIHAFVEMRRIIAFHSSLLQRMEGVERRQLEADHRFEQIFRALERKDIVSNQGIFFDGQVFDAYELVSRLIRSASQSIVLIDNYMDETTLTHLAKKRRDVKVSLLTRNISKQLALDLQKANEQYSGFEARPFNKSHDRFLIIDNKEVYHLGASLKDLGKKWFAFSKMDKSSVESVLKEMDNL